MKETILTSAILILAILAVRQLFQSKVSRRLIYGIWLLVALRLLVPVQFGNFRFSALNPIAPVEQALTELSRNPVSGPSGEEVYTQIIQNYIQQDTSAFTPEVQEDIRHAVDSGAQTPEEIYQQITGEHSAQSLLTPEAQTMAEAAVDAAATALTVGDIATIIWLTGAAFMAVWFLVVNLKHNKQIREVAAPLPCEDSPIPVMVSPLVDSPCLAGLFRPVIYLTPDCASDEVTRRHVLVHELTHYKNKDHIWAFVRCVCLCVYWFHPLVWVAALVSHRDCELACDEGALKRLESGERLDYGKTLLRVVSQAASPTALLHTATSMNESKKQLTERVNYIVKKPKVWISAAICTVLACAVATGCAFAGAPTPAQITEPIISVESTAASVENVAANAPETVTADAAPIRASFQPMGGSGNFFYVPCKTAETNTYEAYPLGENILYVVDNTLTLIDMKTGKTAAQLPYKYPVWVQVIADCVVVEDVMTEMIDIYDSSLQHIKTYSCPALNALNTNWFMGADLKTYYYFMGEYDTLTDICALDLETGKEKVVAADLYQFAFLTFHVPDGLLYTYYDYVTGADRVAFLDLTNGTVTNAPAEGMFEMQSAKIGDVWLLDRGYAGEEVYSPYREYELYVGEHCTTLRERAVRLLEDQKHLVKISDGSMKLYDLEGNLLSACDTAPTNTDFSFGTFFWSESLNGYFVREESDYGNYRLYFWDISVPMTPLGLS